MFDKFYVVEVVQVEVKAEVQVEIHLVDMVDVLAVSENYQTILVSNTELRYGK